MRARIPLTLIAMLAFIGPGCVGYKDLEKMTSNDPSKLPSTALDDQGQPLPVCADIGQETRFANQKGLQACRFAFSFKPIDDPFATKRPPMWVFNLPLEERLAYIARQEVLTAGAQTHVTRPASLPRKKTAMRGQLKAIKPTIPGISAHGLY